MRYAAAVTLTSSANLYSIEQLQLLSRIDLAQWWTEQPVCRDYARSLLRTQGLAAPPLGSQLRIGTQQDGGFSGLGNQPRYEMAEAWVYIDRTTGCGYLQGWFE